VSCSRVGVDIGSARPMDAPPAASATPAEKRPTRDHFFKFMLFWILQCITVWIVSVPFVLMFSRPIQPALGWQDGVGIGLWCVGMLIEAVADAQKFRFKNSSPENRRSMCTIGLWRFSRHPNYFGEGKADFA
jgi:steroid 5-alpha reductase family enzyme